MFSFDQPATKVANDAMRTAAINFTKLRGISSKWTVQFKELPIEVQAQCSPLINGFFGAINTLGTLGHTDFMRVATVLSNDFPECLKWASKGSKWLNREGGAIDELLKDEALVLNAALEILQDYANEPDEVEVDQNEAGSQAQSAAA